MLVWLEGSAPYFEASDGSIIVVVHSVGELEVDGVCSVPEERDAQDSVHGIGRCVLGCRENRSKC